MITISVITCTFNAEAVVARTLESVREQTFHKVEHIIIDGLSADGTLALVDDYREKTEREDNGHRVVVVAEKDNGLYDAMNKGILKASGDYLVFLNAGDVFPSSETLEHVLSGFADGEDLPGVLYGDADIVNNDGFLLRHRRLRPPSTLSWRSFKHGMLVCHQAFYARADLARETLYDRQYRFSADVDWCIRIMKLAEERGLQLRNVNEVLVNYLDGGMTEKSHRASLLERFRVMAHHYGMVTTVGMHLWFVVRAVIRK